MIDETDAFRFSGAHQLASHQVFFCSRITDQLRPNDRSPITGNKTDAHMRVADLCRVGREGDVTKESERGAKAGSMAVHLGDDRLLAIEKRKNDLLGLDRRLRPGVAFNQAFLHLSDIAAGAQAMFRAGEDEDVAIWVIGRIRENACQFSMKRRIYGVASLGAVQDDLKDPRAALE